LIGAIQFIEILVNTPFPVCELHETKTLYRHSRETSYQT